MAETSYATSADLTVIEDTIKDILNAGEAGTFGGAVTDKRRSAEAIVSARRKATMEIVKAIASNPQNGFYQVLATDIDVDSGMKLPPYLGTLGIPQIQAFDGADFADGIEERPEMIDYYRSSLGDNLSQTLNQASQTAHNLPYSGLFPSRGAGKYSLRSSVIKFTGFACTITLVISPPAEDGADRNEWIDAHLPAFLIDACIGLSFQYLVKEGDNISSLAQSMVQTGKSELNNVRGGSAPIEAQPKISDRQRIIR